MAGPNTLYQTVLSITTDYLGPAAKRFIDRQIDSHLQKKPENLTKQDIHKLIEWSRVSMAMLTDDEHLVNDYVDSLRELINGGRA